MYAFKKPNKVVSEKASVGPENNDQSDDFLDSLLLGEVKN